jgi:hypothetical protein
MSTYNRKNTSTYWYVDPEGMVCVNGDENSWKDSIGNNFDLYVGTKDHRLVADAKRCFDFDTCEEFQRHPVKTTGELSRDHLSYGLVLFLYAGRSDWFFEVADKLKWQFNHKHSMRGMYLWVKSFYNRWWRTLFYTAKIPEMLVIRLVNYSVRKWAKIGPEVSQEEWDLDTTRNRTERQIKAFEYTFPAYALHNFIWQLEMMPDTFFKKILQRITLPLVGVHNYPLQHMLGQEVDLYLVDTYECMSGSRWTTTLDPLNDRHVEKMKKELVYENGVDRLYMLGVVYNKGVIDYNQEKSL